MYGDEENVDNMDDYEKAEHAKNMVPFDETSDTYFVYWFLSLRFLGIEVREAVTIVRTHIRKSGHRTLNYRMVYKKPDENLGNESTKKMYENFRVTPQKSVEEFEKKSQHPPLSNLQQLLWAEVLTSGTRTPQEFEKKVVKLKSRIVNRSGG